MDWIGVSFRDKFYVKKEKEKKEKERVEGRVEKGLPTMNTCLSSVSR